MQLITHHATSRGGRYLNEDVLKVVKGEHYALLLLADGLGGHGDGGLAAACCVETIADAFVQAPGLSDDLLHGLVDKADQAIAAKRIEQRLPPNSALTTLVMLAFIGGQVRWAHVGDSRIYWFRRGRLMHRTRDHTVAELVSGLPADAPTAPPHPADRNRLLRVIGAGTGCRAELADAPIVAEPDDAFLLCSDGVWSVISDQEITGCLSKASDPVDWGTGLEEKLRIPPGSQATDDRDNYAMVTAMIEA